MYILMNENTIEPYNGEILKRYVGNKMVNAISNPTDEDLKEFGYMELIEGVSPEYDASTQYIETTYNVEDGMIHEVFEVKDIPEEDMILPNIE